MPLPKRHVDPTFVARSVYESSEFQEATDLETVTNTTLTNIIRQLSSLSKHSEDLFGELARDAGSLADRANSLQARIDRLAIKVTQLDSTVEDVSLTEIQLKKAFRSATVFDQQIFSRATMPAPMLETYQQCDKPPPPPPLLESPPKIPNGDLSNGMIQPPPPQQIQPAVNKQALQKKILPPFQDNRSDLMKAIRDGIKLRKVEKCDKEIERTTAFHDVASILARRVAIELSESESSESEDDSEGWVEPNETSA